MAGDADVIVVGGGLAGLVAATEIADAGKQVILLDQEGEQSLGGQAFWSFGGLFLVNSPEQRRLGIRDSYDLALQDWMGTAGFDREEDLWPKKWAEAYVAFAAGEKRDWLRAMGHRVFPVVGWAERSADGMVSSGWCPPAVEISAAELRNMSIDEIKDALAFETARADCLGYFDGPAVRRCIDALVDHGIWCDGFTDILFVETDAGGQRYWAAGGRPETDQHPKDAHDFIPAIRRSLRELGVTVSDGSRHAKWILANRHVQDIVFGRVDPVVGASVLRSFWSEYYPDDQDGETAGLGDLMAVYWDWDSVEDGLLWAADEASYVEALKRLRATALKEARDWIREHPPRGTSTTSG